MLNINEVRNGRLYSVVFEGPVRMLKGGRAGVPENPLMDIPVTKRIVLSVQACTRESYARRMRKLDPNWEPSNKPSGFTPTENPCVDLNPQGEASLRCWAIQCTKKEVFVGGQPATPEQLAIIQQFKPTGKAPGFMRLPLAKIQHEGWEDSVAEVDGNVED